VIATDPVADPLAIRAKAYPFRLLDHSFLMTAQGPRPMAKGEAIPGRDHRFPVLASGSNMSPDRLAEKYPVLREPIAVQRARVTDFDSVYTAHVTSYGAIAATPFPSPGTVAHLAVLWLTEKEVVAMHETEALGNHYVYGRFDGIDILLESGEQLTGAFSYVTLRGALTRNGAPIPLAALAADNRRWPALDESAVLLLVRDRLAPGADLDGFIRASCENSLLRLERSDDLTRDALPFHHSALTVLLP
jgi:hypothetical protein